MPNELAKKIIDSVTPIAGKIISHVSLKIACVQMNKTMETIEEDDLEKLSRLVGTAMAAVGKNGAEISAKIRSLI